MRARQLQLKQTILKKPEIPKVFEKAVRAVLDDTHMNQTAARKILMDRILHISTFEKQFDNREKITINISAIGKESETLEGEVIEQ